MRLAYTRVSAADQNSERQQETLKSYSIDKYFEDAYTGKTMDRPKLQEILAYAREGDEIFVCSIDRMGRNMRHLQEIVDTLLKKGVSITFIKEKLSFKSGSENPIDRLMFYIIGAMAEFERSLISERQREGIAIAKAKGKYKGTRCTISFEKWEKIQADIAMGIPKARVARNHRITVCTIYNYLRGRSKPINKNVYHCADNQSGASCSSSGSFLAT